MKKVLNSLAAVLVIAAPSFASANDCDTNEAWLRHISSVDYFYAWWYENDKKVQAHYRFRDGQIQQRLTAPGGKQFGDWIIRRTTVRGDKIDYVAGQTWNLERKYADCGLGFVGGRSLAKIDEN